MDGDIYLLTAGTAGINFVDMAVLCRIVDFFYKIGRAFGTAVLMTGCRNGFLDILVANRAMTLFLAVGRTGCRRNNLVILNAVTCFLRNMAFKSITAFDSTFESFNSSFLASCCICMLVKPITPKIPCFTVGKAIMFNCFLSFRATLTRAFITCINMAVNQMIVDSVVYNKVVTESRNFGC